MIFIALAKKERRLRPFGGIPPGRSESHTGKRRKKKREGRKALLRGIVCSFLLPLTQKKRRTVKFFLVGGKKREVPSLPNPMKKVGLWNWGLLSDHPNE